MKQRPLPSFLIFRDSKGGWRWNFASPSGRIIAVSSVAYQHRQGCAKAIRMLQGQVEIPVVVANRPAREAEGAQPILAEPAPAESLPLSEQPSLDPAGSDATAEMDDEGLDPEPDQILH
ncbi:MAG: YegP family protein [Sphingomonadales bacterium]